MGSRSGATIRTVAERAGVSTATVSYVLSGRGGGNTRVSEATRDRVIKAADELGWVPNQSARGMRRGRTDQVCLVLRQPSSSWAQAMADQVAATARDYGLNTLMLVGGDWQDFLLRRGADAAFIDLEHVTEVDATGFRPLVNRGVSLVVMNPVLEPAGFDVVRTEQAVACAEAMRLLTARHRRIGWLGERPATSGGRVPESFAAYRRGLAAAGSAADIDLVRFTGGSREMAYREAITMLSGPRRPDAIFAATDLIGISALWAAHRLGIRVPEELSIIGTGNAPEGVVADPPLTTVGPESIFPDVAGLLLSRLRGEAPVVGRLYRSRWVLHRRGTT